LKTHLENERDLISTLTPEEQELLTQILRGWLTALGDQRQPVNAVDEGTTDVMSAWDQPAPD
jgi:hypothetical protein